jgi:hypothetical protein
MKMVMAVFSVFAFSSIPLAALAQDTPGRPIPVQDEEAAIAIATKLCANQIKGTPVRRFAQKNGDHWDVVSQRTDQKITVPDWWTVTIPISGPNSDAGCVGHRGVIF